MKRRVLPEPVLHIDPSWHPPLMRWRTKVHGMTARWGYAAWWCSGVEWYTGALRRAKKHYAAMDPGERAALEHGL